MRALVVRGSSRRGIKFNIHLDQVFISREAIEGVIACVWNFLRDPSFTQNSFFSDSVVVMLKDDVAVADSVMVSGEYNP